MHTQLDQRPTYRAVAALATPFGRGIRVVLGLVLIALGLGFIAQPYGSIVAIVGIVPIAAGLLNWCLVAPLVGAPLHGRDAQQRRGR